MIRIQFCRKHVLIRTQYDLVCLRADLCHKHRVTKCNPKTFSLSDRVMCDPFMSSEYFSIRRHKISGRRHKFSTLFINKSRIIIIRDKTNLHAVFFVCDHQPDLLCNLADLVLMIISDRHECSRQLRLRQIVKCISLVFLGGDRIFDRITAIWKLLNPCIMSGRNVICTDCKTPV